MQQHGQLDPIIVTIFVVTGYLVNEISSLGLIQDVVLTIISILLILVVKHLKDPGNIFLPWGRWERAACLLEHIQYTYNTPMIVQHKHIFCTLLYFQAQCMHGSPFHTTLELFVTNRTFASAISL